MQNYNSRHFEKAVELLRHFDGAIPLQYFLKKYYIEHKKHGSKDRRVISHYCYTYFRLGHNLMELPIEDRLKISLFLCTENNAQNLLEGIVPNDWLLNSNLDLLKKIEFIQSIYSAFTLFQLFPYTNLLSAGIDAYQLELSMLVQPNLFLRIRAHEQNVEHKLTQAGVCFEKPAPDCLALPNSTKIEGLLTINEEVVIQDISSQKIASYLTFVKEQLEQRPIKVWDACAASGGKSILAIDNLDQLLLSVSDIRPVMLQNLKTRFKQAKIEKYRSFTADLSKPFAQKSSYDLIICDAPCTGSGTWSRTPESLFFFDNQTLDQFQGLQQNIVRNCLAHLKKSGYFLYITCSVFAQENEEIVSFILKEFPLKCIKAENITGYAQKGDSMFAALFSFAK